MQHFQNVVRITRRCRETGVLEAIHADGQSTPNLFRAVRMRDDWKFARVRFVVAMHSSVTRQGTSTVRS